MALLINCLVVAVTETEDEQIKVMVFTEYFHRSTDVERENVLLSK